MNNDNITGYQGKIYQIDQEGRSVQMNMWLGDFWESITSFFDR